ncbi:hypothetical protein OAory_01018580 [Aspergillus oryzae]|nr:hypothetical protein OAory_01018580 [Aspergillus oryzae]
MKLLNIITLLSTTSLAVAGGLDTREANNADLATRAATICGSGYELNKAIPLPKGTDPKQRLGTLYTYIGKDKGCAILDNNVGKAQYMYVGVCDLNGKHCDKDSGAFSQYAGPIYISNFACAPLVAKMGQSSKSLYIDYKDEYGWACEGPKFYRQWVYPFNPILVDMGRFELDLFTYLNAYAAVEFESHSKSDKWTIDRSIAHISLLLATLSAGAYYSDLDLAQQSYICHDLARRSFQALRLANFLFRPSLDVVQALLVLDNMFQNNGQSDAAWALLGTTVRLAQTIGLHTERSIAYLPQYMQLKAKTLWYVLAVDPYCSLRNLGLSGLLFDKDDLVQFLRALPDTLRSLHLSLLYFLNHGGTWASLLAKMRDMIAKPGCRAAPETGNRSGAAWYD